MTFSIAARCVRTGQFGVAVSRSSPAVAARCSYARAGVGAVSSQNITDPSLGPRILDLMSLGASAPEALSVVSHSTENIEFRQLTAVDALGCAASFSGEHTLGVHAAMIADNVVCAGNLLKNDTIPSQMVSAFDGCVNEDLADRLLQAMQAGVAAGGEEGSIHSAGLLLVDKYSWPVANLRIDWHEAGSPIDELSRLWQRYAPQLNDYVIRAINPSSAPGYGVPGEE